MRACDSSDTWRMGVRRLAVANGPNVFQMLLVDGIYFVCHVFVYCVVLPTWRVANGVKVAPERAHE